MTCSANRRETAALLSDPTSTSHQESSEDYVKENSDTVSEKIVLKDSTKHNEGVWYMKRKPLKFSKAPFPYLEGMPFSLPLLKS